MVLPSPHRPPLDSEPGSSPRATVRESGRALIGVGVPDEELVARMRQEDLWAKEAFYRKHVEQAHRVAFRLVKNQHDAEDVVQEAFAQGFRDLPKLREPSLARSWLMRIVVNRAHRRFRRRRLLTYFGFQQQEEPVFEVRATSASPETKAELALVEDILEDVPLKLKTAWVLRYVEGCTCLKSPK